VHKENDMALELVQPGIQPLGQFDGHDDYYLTVKGGEVGTIVGVALAADSGSADVDDGYAVGGAQRPVITSALTSGDRPLGLIDDGLWGYGTLFGSVIGGIAGQVSYGLGQVPAQQLGPHTATASGKLTFWDKPGTYAVTLDAVDTNVTSGLHPQNPTLGIGDALYATAAGLLTPNSGSAFEAVEVGYFLNFEPWKGGSLVTTPVNLVSAANSPVGQGQPQSLALQRALIHFNPPSQS
jgi:hypothetical protein